MSLVRDHDFRLVWAGQGVSDLGTSVSFVVMPLVAVVYLHASALEVGTLAALAWLPWLLIGLPAGVWVDRSRKRVVMVWCDVVRFAAVGSIPLVAAFDALTIGQLLAVAFVTGLATVLFQVSYQAYLPVLVPRTDLGEANAKLQGTGAATNVLGPGLGGMLVEALRAPFALLADALSYAVSVVALLAIRGREPRPERVEGRSVRAEIAEGAAFVARDPLLRALTVSPAVSNLCFIGYEAIVVLFLVRSVHLSPGVVGLLLAVAAVGSVLGALVARRAGRLLGTSRVTWLSMVVAGLGGLLIPLVADDWRIALFVVGNVITMAGVLAYNVTVGAFRQAYCPPQLLGRVVASMRVIVFGAMPLGALAAGALAAAYGPRTAIWIVMIGNVLPGVILVLSPLRRMRDLPA